MADFSKLLDRIPENAKKKLGSGSKVCLVSGKDVFDVFKDEKVIIMACNTRIRHVIPGIMRAARDLDAIVAFELAKSEGDVDGGYTGMDPNTYSETVIGYAEEEGFELPFFIHGDHITIKDTSDKAVAGGQALINAEIEAGYTSFAIDASFNEIPDNIAITAKLAGKIVDAGAGLEVEVGEVRSTGQDAEISTVEEATEFVDGLNAKDVHPNLLAINNGSKHGNYNPDEEVHIDLKRTSDIYEAIRGKGLSIAQHGITGTPLDLMGQFADNGIRKGNVGTLWQNVAHECMQPELLQTLKDWARENDKDIKMATKVFKKEIDSMPAEFINKTVDKAHEEAKAFIKAFRAEGTASKLAERIC